MRKCIITLLFILSVFCVSAQKIFSVDHQYQADIKVYVTDKEYRADIVVFKTDKEYRAKANENKGIWYFTDKQFLADMEASLEFSMDKAGIFRVLELFAEKDEVHVIEDGSRSLKYELCHSGTKHSIADQHAHFYCEHCKETYCIESARVPLIDIPDGIIPHSINYMIKGICPKCSKWPK